jgi:hypothetical protein
MPSPPGCGTPNSNLWEVLRGTFSCSATAVNIYGPTGTAQLGGTRLNQLPNGQSYPTDYVAQAHLQLLQQSAFGLYFRNQSGGFPLRTYAFLVSPDGTWQANLYDNTTETPKQLTGGTQTLVSSTGTWVTLSVVVKGTNFSFYINNTFVGATQDSTYASGTAGIAVDHDGGITTDQFSLYAIKP